MDERGPFDKILQSEPAPPERDRSATIIVAIAIGLGILLLILVLPPVSILDSGGGGNLEDVASNFADELPAAPPEGFEPVSGLVEVTAQGGGGPYPISLSLATTVPDGSPLTFFAFRDGEWHELGSATAVAGGKAAQGEVTSLPENIAVMRGAGSSGPDEPSARIAIGTLAPGAQPDARALSTITTLFVSGFAPQADGSISGALQAPDDIAVPIAPAVAVTNADEADAVNAILASQELTAAHTEALLGLVDASSAAGLELDYRGMDPARGDAFVALAIELADALHADDRQLILTLPLPVQGPDGWDTLGFDWEALAVQADGIKLPTIADQDRYFSELESALAFLVPQVGGSKLLLTVQTLSRERGTDGVRAITLLEALSLATNAQLDTDEAVTTESSVQATGTNLEGGLAWDSTASAVTYRYTGPGGERTVWLANVFSEAFRLDLARRYQLGGVAAEDVSADTSAANIWTAVAQFVQEGEVDLVTPNGALLEPYWTASAGTIDDPSGATVTWQTPSEAGDYTLTLTISDGIVRVGQELGVAVETSAAAP